MTEKFKLYLGDSMKVLRELPEASIDSVVTDPPYHLTSIVKRFGSANAAPAQHGTDGAFARASRGFMGKEWDGGDIAFRAEFWPEVLRVLKPGGHLLAFSGSRTYHRMACAIEDAGFEIRDSLQWVHGSGFPKSHNVSKGIDKSAGAERAKVRIPADDLKNPPNLVGGVGKGDDRPWRQEALERGYHEVDSDDPATEDAALWNGWGSALKPAHEPIALARKPLGGSIAANVLEHGTGAINIDGCRIHGTDAEEGRSRHGGGLMQGASFQLPDSISSMPAGRWPSNVLIDGSDEVTRLLPGDAASFFYCPKASKEDRNGGLDGYKYVIIEPQEGESWENEASQVKLLVGMEQSVLRVIDVFGASNKNVIEWNIMLFGKESTGLSLKDTTFTIKTAINSITKLTISNYFPNLLTSENIAAAKSETAGGGSLAESAANFSLLLNTTNERMASALGAVNAASKMRLKISVEDAKSGHPTVKPVDLMRYLCRLITPPGGVILDPFMGSGSTGKAAMLEFFEFVGIDLTPEYYRIAESRIKAAADQPKQTNLF